ncbi:hypothetical protein TRICI_003754 [Trichomonascus ciferrii]|uniref:Regulator of phospholipase D SRF1 n=1 Tax=Trichomonascus ciferrii TaxID=44093 RepID=A0A642V945_9ASCO|nr:hypothetical protein TRICI_003754 [Trichomonascus ciferrii]
MSSDEISFPSPRKSSGNPKSNGRTRTNSDMGASSVSFAGSTYTNMTHGNSVARPMPAWIIDNGGGTNRQHTSFGIDHQQTPTTYYNDSTTETKSRWNAFIDSTTRPDVYEKGYVDEKALLDQGDYEGSWLGIIEDPTPSSGRGCLPRRKTKQGRNDKAEPYPRSSARYFVSEESREVWKPRLNFILLNNPYVPLTLRAIIFILSVAALGLAGNIFVRSQEAHPAPLTQQPSTIMAIVVQSTALVYLVYITYDEYSGKPIGLREPKAKMRLIMLDLLFIIFSSANLSLTFNTLYDVTWTCHVGHDTDEFAQIGLTVPYNYAICSRQRGLASFLFMVLVMWVATFTISIFRLVERVSQ